MKAEAWQCRDGLWVAPFHRSPGLWESMSLFAWTILSIRSNVSLSFPFPLAQVFQDMETFTFLSWTFLALLCMSKCSAMQTQTFLAVILSASGKDQIRQTRFSWGTQAGCFTTIAPSYLMFSLKELPQEILVNRTRCTGSSQHTEPAVLAAAHCRPYIACLAPFTFASCVPFSPPPGSHALVGPSLVSMGTESGVSFLEALGALTETERSSVRSCVLFRFETGSH